jgi:metal-sulfur cluster biosynthetic enzyme
MGSMIVAQAREALAGRLPADTAIDVNLVWDPPWEPARMSPKAREHFGWK